MLLAWLFKMLRASAAPLHEPAPSSQARRCHSTPLPPPTPSLHPFQPCRNHVSGPCLTCRSFPGPCRRLPGFPTRLLGERRPWVAGPAKAEPGAGGGERSAREARGASTKAGEPVSVTPERLGQLSLLAYLSPQPVQLVPATSLEPGCISYHLRSTSMAARLSSSAMLSTKPRPGQLGLLTLASSRLGHPPLAQRLFSSTARLDKQRLVILGSGWGGYELLRKVNRSLYGKRGDGDGSNGGGD